MEMASRQAGGGGTRDDSPAGTAWGPPQVDSGRAAAGESPSPASHLARGMGWFSIGLGLAQVTAPGPFARLVGSPDGPRARLVVRAMGVRELASGLGILASSRPVPWLWSRVAGDGLDLALLGAAAGAAGSNRGRVAAAMSAVAGATVADIFDGLRLREEAAPVAAGPMRVRAATTIDRSAQDLYRFWRDFENLPHFMTHLESVEVADDGRRSHWTIKAPVRQTVEWDAEITEDTPGEVIAWRSLEGADVVNSGSVRFLAAPGNRGTEVHVDLLYQAAGGPVRAAIAKLFGEEPSQQVKDDLRRFKQVMETGQVVRSEGSPDGTHAGRQLRQRPARPLPARDR